MILLITNDACMLHDLALSRLKNMKAIDNAINFIVCIHCLLAQTSLLVYCMSIGLAISKCYRT